MSQDRQLHHKAHFLHMTFLMVGMAARCVVGLDPQNYNAASRAFVIHAAW